MRKVKISKTKQTTLAKTRLGLSLIEVLVVAATSGVLLALLAPAIHAVRATSRKLHCQSNLRQIGVASHQYHDLFGSFATRGVHAGWAYRLLPHMGESTLYARGLEIGQGVTVAYPESIGVLQYRCPSDARVLIDPALVSYLPNEGDHRLQTSIRGLRGHPGLPWQASRDGRFQDVIDGSSNTALFSERLVSEYLAQRSTEDAYSRFVGSNVIEQVPKLQVWYLAQALPNDTTRYESFLSACEVPSNDVYPVMADVARRVFDARQGYTHVVGPNRRGCYGSTAIEAATRWPLMLAAIPPTSDHQHGVNVLFVDGSVRFFGDSVNSNVWRAVGTPSGGEFILN